MRQAITERQRRAIEALMAGETQAAAAQAAGVSVRQLQRWLAESVAFRAALRQAEGAALNRVTRHLVRLADDACSVLAQALRGDANAAQVRAADIVLQRMLNVRELAELEARVSALEARYESQSENPAT